MVAVRTAFIVDFPILEGLKLRYGFSCSIDTAHQIMSVIMSV